MLAAEQRSLVTRDVDTEKLVSVPLEITVIDTKDGTKEDEGIDVEEEDDGEEDYWEGGEEVYFKALRKRSSFSASGAVLRVRTPCLLPPLDSIVSIRVLPPRYVSFHNEDSPFRYWERTLYPKDNMAHRVCIEKHRTLYVKRKAGYLSYDEDKSGQRSLANR